MLILRCSNCTSFHHYHFQNANTGFCTKNNNTTDCDSLCGKHSEFSKSLSDSEIEELEDLHDRFFDGEKVTEEDKEFYKELKNSLTEAAYVIAHYLNKKGGK